MSWYPPSPLELLAGAWQLCEGQASDGAHVVRRQGRAWVRRWPVGRLVVKHQISLLLGHNPPLSVRLELFSEGRRKLEQWRPGRLRSWSSHKQLRRHYGVGGGSAGADVGATGGQWGGGVCEALASELLKECRWGWIFRRNFPNISEEGDAVNCGSCKEKDPLLNWSSISHNFLLVVSST